MPIFSYLAEILSPQVIFLDLDKKNTFIPHSGYRLQSNCLPFGAPFSKKEVKRCENYYDDEKN